MLLGELDLNAAPAVSALSKVDAKFATTTSGLARMEGMLGGAITGFVTLATVLDGFHGAITLAGTLNDLSLRTGETIADLVMLRESFQEAGLGADAVEPFILKLQNALGGVNEEGGKTTDAFAALGVTAEQLGKLNTKGQLEALKKGLAGIGDQATKVQVLRNLFGKSGGQMLSLLGDDGALAKGSKHAKALAAIAEKAAPAMDNLGDAMDGAKLHVQELFFGLSDKLAPALTDMIDRWDNIDFVAIGQGVGSVLSPLIEVANALRTVYGIADAAVEKLAQLTLGDKAGANYSALSKRAQEGWDERHKKQKTDMFGSDGTPLVGALQKVGGGGIGGGGHDPHLNAQKEANGHLRDIKLHLGRLTTGQLTTGNLVDVPV